MSQLLDDLKAVRELLSVPERWTKGEHARTNTGCPVPINSRRAKCWCLEGATARAVKSDERFNNTWGCLLDMFRQDHPDAKIIGGIIEWNDADDRTHADVLALLDKAIAAEERK